MANLKQRPSDSERDGPPEWVSWKLRKFFLTLMFCITLGLATGVVTLLAFSNVRHGVHLVNDQPRHFLVDWDIGLAWTAVPSFIFQLYALGVGMIVTAFGFRQPFIELRQGATTQKTIALDYGSYFSGQNAWKAARNGHWHLAFPFLVSILLTVIVGPLSSHMLSEHSYDHQESAVVSQNQVFFSQYSLGEPINWDLAPVIGLTSATAVYGGSFARWVDGKNAYVNFSSPVPPGSNFSQPTLEANTSAFYSKLDCRILDNSASDNHWYIDVSGPNSTNSWFYVNATDRGCSWSSSFYISQAFTTYLQTRSNVSCGRYGTSDRTGRLIILAADIENFQLLRLSMLSCIPTYWISSGNLTIDLDQNTLHPITGYAENNSTVKELRPNWWTLFEVQIQQINFVDTSVSFRADSTTALGSVILAHSRRNSADPLSGNSLVAASQTVWQNLYATLVNTNMLRLGETSQMSALLTTTENRLFVNKPIAGIILGFLFLGALLLIMTLVYTGRNRSVLFEEPVGLVGYAGLLYDSVLNTMVGHARETPNFRGATTEDVNSSLDRTDAQPAMFRMDQFRDPKRARIVRGMSSGDQELDSLNRPIDETLASESYASSTR